MSLVSDIMGYGSVSVVGMEKNTGKTETLTHILRGLPTGLAVAVTSVGTDGEGRDHIYGTPKPEITLRRGVVFATAEEYYGRRRIMAELLAVDSASSAAGRIVTARALSDGRTVLSGPPTSERLSAWKSSLGNYGVEFTLIDGALSRMSSASPAVSDAIVLATGAALSPDMRKVVRETAYAVEKIGLPLSSEEDISRFAGLSPGVWFAERGDGTVFAGPASTLAADGIPDIAAQDGVTVYVNGALTERLVDAIRSAAVEIREIVVDDFTRIFLSWSYYRAFVRGGGRIAVLRASVLAAVTVNPVSPSGFSFDARRLREEVARAVGVPVYDIFDQER